MNNVDLIRERNDFKKKYIKKRNTWTPNDILIYDNYAEVVLRDNKQNIIDIAIIDKDDINLIREYKWCLHKTGYPSSKHNGSTTTMHRILFNFPNGVIDHKNRDKMDNRRANLKVGTQGDNNKNKTTVREREQNIILVNQNVN